MKDDVTSFSLVKMGPRRHQAKVEEKFKAMKLNIEGNLANSLISDELSSCVFPGNYH